MCGLFPSEKRRATDVCAIGSPKCSEWNPLSDEGNSTLSYCDTTIAGFGSCTISYIVLFVSASPPARSGWSDGTRMVPCGGIPTVCRRLLGRATGWLALFATAFASSPPRSSSTFSCIVCGTTCVKRRCGGARFSTCRHNPGISCLMSGGVGIRSSKPLPIANSMAVIGAELLRLLCPATAAALGRAVAVVTLNVERTMAV